VKSHQRIYEALLTGVPYGFFKFLTGWYLIQFQVHIVGYPLMAMGVIDIVLNLVGVFRPAPFPLCTLVVLGRTLPHTSRKKADEFALALDTLASFALVSSMIWFGAIGYVASTFGRLWDACVILNIVSVGVARVYASFRV
jgi:hypothetical protein